MQATTYSCRSSAPISLPWHWGNVVLTQPFFWKKNTVAMDVSKHSPRVKSRLSLSKPTKTLSKLHAPLNEHSSFNTSWEIRLETWNRHVQKLEKELNVALLSRSYETQAVGSRKLLDWPRKSVSAPFPRPRDILHQVQSAKRTKAKRIGKGASEGQAPPGT